MVQLVYLCAACACGFNPHSCHSLVFLIENQSQISRKISCSNLVVAVTLPNSFIRRDSVKIECPALSYLTKD